MPVVDFSLAGKVAIVTGGSRGIGRSIAIGLAENGADVVIAARKPDAIAEAVAAVEATGRRALGIPSNVRRSEDLRMLVDRTRADLGRVDILVNNAGTNPVYGPIEEIDEGVWDLIMNTNVKAVHLLSNFAREAMLEHGEGGSIINVASVSGLRPSPGTAVYGAAKAGLINLSQSLAIEWAPKLRVNAVALGMVRTPQSDDHYGGPEGVERVAATVPLGRMAQAQDLAQLCLFLDSEEASYLTGACIPLHGGGEEPAFIRAATGLAQT